MSWVRLLNSLWAWHARPALRQFHLHSRSVATTQARLLLETLRQNQRSDYGQRYKFGGIRGWDDFRERVPIVGYDDLAACIDRIARGEDGVLTANKVELLEPTSGSTSARKLIPYTRALRRQFQQAISAWIADLFLTRPKIRRGRAYWSITPGTFGYERTSGGLRVGFAEDTEYLPSIQRMVARRLLAVPHEVIKGASSQQFRRLTLLYLLAAEDLALISIWSPTFLTTMLRELEEATDHLLQRLPSITNGRRCDEVASALTSGEELSTKLQRLWPNLALVSCWADASASLYVGQLASLLPNVEIQPKGLLSTECCVSFPLAGESGAALAIDSHGFEFAAEGSTDTHLAHELTCGRRYKVIVTTGGGLYRYDTQDWIRVVGFHNECPLIRFEQRERTSDLVGEKLNERFVAQSIDQALKASQLPPPNFATLIPMTDGPSYRLLLQFDRPHKSIHAERIAKELERRLSENPYYRHAVEMGQLQRSDVLMVQTGHASLWDHYERSSLQRGVKLGDLKPTALDTETDWQTVLSSCLLSS